MSNGLSYNSSFSNLPINLKLRQTITSSGPVNIPSSIKKVWVMCVGAGGGGGMGSKNTTTSFAVTAVNTNPAITSIAINTPYNGYATYYTAYTPRVNQSVYITGFGGTAAYVGTKTVISVDVGVSFTCYTGTNSAPASNSGNFGGVVVYNIGSHQVQVGNRCSVTGITPTSLNLSTTAGSSGGVSAVTSTEIVFPNTANLSATTYTSGGTVSFATTIYGGSGGGGGAVSCGWTPVPTSCVVGLGGTTPVDISSGKISTFGMHGGTTSFGVVFAPGGGGGGGVSDSTCYYKNNDVQIITRSTGLGGSGSGGGFPWSGGTINRSFNRISGSVGGSPSDSSSTTFAMGGAGSPGKLLSSINDTVKNGENGLTGGGGGSVLTSALATGPSGGNGGMWTTYNGGSGSVGTGYNFGAGGGGAGILENGYNASGINGGNGGNGGGGGGGSTYGGTPGIGGNGVIFVYY